MTTRNAEVEALKAVLGLGLPYSQTISEITEAVHAWIREDTPITIKMRIEPEHVAALVRRLAALRAPAGGGSAGAEAGFDASRTAAPYSREEIAVLYDESRGWHDCLDSGAVGNGAFMVRSSTGQDSDQIRLNLRGWLRDIGTVLLGILSRDAASDTDPPGSPDADGGTEGRR